MMLFHSIFLILGLTSLVFSADEINSEERYKNTISQLITLGSDIQSALRCGYQPEYPQPPISIKVSFHQFILYPENFDPDSYPTEWKLTYMDRTEEDGTIIQYPTFKIEKSFVVSTYLGSGMEGFVFKVIDQDTQEELALKVYRGRSNMMDWAMMRYRFYKNNDDRQKIRELCNLPLYVNVNEKHGLTISPLLDHSRWVDPYSAEYKQHLEDLKKVLPNLRDRSTSNTMYDFNEKLKAIDFCW